MLKYSEQEFLFLLEEKFSDEIEQNKLKFKILKLNDFDVMIFISKEDVNRTNSIVFDTNIKYSVFEIDGQKKYTLEVYENNIEQLFLKVKKTIFNICLIGK